MPKLKWKQGLYGLFSARAGRFVLVVGYESGQYVGRIDNEVAARYPSLMESQIATEAALLARLSAAAKALSCELAEVVEHKI